MKSKQQQEIEVSSASVLPDDVGRTIFEQTSDGMFVTDGQGRCLAANQPGCDLVGYTRTQLLALAGPELPFLVALTENREVKQPLAQLLNSRTTLCQTGQLRRGDGHARPVQIHGQPLADGGWLWVVRTLSEGKQSGAAIGRQHETLEQQLAERTAQLAAITREFEDLAYSISHDLRAPLRAIDGYTRILQEDYEPFLDAEGRRVCAVVRDEAQRMGQLMADLLSFSQLNREEMQLGPINMNQLVEVVFDSLTTPTDRERLDFQVAPLPEAMGDSTLMRQVWFNLLANALKFSAKRPKAIIAINGQPSDNEVIFSIRDNGAGFDMRYADKLFGVFQRFHSEREFEGTGIGLAVMRRIIHRHQGRVWAESEPDEGATFYFTLPR